MFESKGKKIINNSVSAFNRIIEDLNIGIQYCEQEVLKQKEIKQDAEQIVEELNHEIEKARIISENIREIIGA